VNLGLIEGRYCTREDAGVCVARWCAMDGLGDCDDDGKEKLKFWELGSVGGLCV
jgi:hypothetical protein